MIAVPAFRTLHIVNVPENHNTFRVTDRFFITEEITQDRIQNAADIRCRAFLFLGQQKRQPDTEPALDCKADLYRHDLFHHGLHVLRRPWVPGVGRKRSGQQCHLLTVLGQFQRRRVGKLHILAVAQASDILEHHVKSAVLCFDFIQQMNE